MTDKQFELCEINCFDYGVEVFNEIMDNGVPLSQKQVCELLNGLSEENTMLKLQVETKLFSRRELEKENEQLKQREENLLSEIEDFQELLSKNDGVCYERVIDLIDNRICNFSNVRTELLLHSDDDYRLEKLSFAIQNLRELKKELEE